MTFHQINSNPINYKEDHYKRLIKNKIKESDMESVVAGNLKMMDRILDSRKIIVSEAEAMKSETALIAYISQSEYGRWIVNNYAHLSDLNRQIFREGVNKVLPYIADKEQFISNIKYSMKADMCKRLDYHCLLEDSMRMDNSPNILSDKGFKYLHDKYKEKLYADMKDMAQQWGYIDSDIEGEDK